MCAYLQHSHVSQQCKCPAVSFLCCLRLLQVLLVADGSKMHSHCHLCAVSIGLKLVDKI